MVDKTLEVETYEPQTKKTVEPVKLEQFSEKLQVKLARLLDIRSHSLDRGDLEALIDQMSDLALSKWDPMEKARRAADKAPTIAKDDALVPATSRVDEECKPPPGKRTYIRAGTRHFVRLRDGGCCRICGSTHATQVDHIIPPSRGGTNESSNLRLLCRSCNLRRAVEVYGAEKMARYLKEPQQLYLSFGASRFARRRAAGDH